jgi:3-mercaptopyruvate sulfurtransferase SseA
MRKSPDEILVDSRSSGISPKDQVFLYCFKAARASNTYVALKDAGFSDVRMYFGSWNEWSRKRGCRSSRGSTRIEHASYDIGPPAGAPVRSLPRTAPPQVM